MLETIVIGMLLIRFEPIAVPAETARICANESPVATDRISTSSRWDSPAFSTAWTTRKSPSTSTIRFQETDLTTSRGVIQPLTG